MKAPSTPSTHNELSRQIKKAYTRLRGLLPPGVRIHDGHRMIILKCFPPGLLPSESSDLVEIHQMALVAKVALGLINGLHFLHSTRQTMPDECIMMTLRDLRAGRALKEDHRTILEAHLATACGFEISKAPNGIFLLARVVTTFVFPTVRERRQRNLFSAVPQSAAA